MYTLCVAVVNDLLLGQRGVVLDLVGGRDNGGLGQKFLQVLDTVVGDTYSLSFAASYELLHILPGRDVGVAVDNVPRTIRKLGEDRMVSYIRLEEILVVGSRDQL